MTTTSHLPSSPDDSPLRPSSSSKLSLIRPSTPPSQLAQNLPIIQTQSATPLGPTPSSSFGTRRSGSPSPTTGRSGGGDEDEKKMLRGATTSLEDVDEGLLAGSGSAADEETASRRGSTVEREKEKMKETEKRTLWFGDLEPWMDDNYMRHTCLLMGWRIESIKLIRASTQSTLALPSGQTPLNAGYCFITFPTEKDALDALTTVTPTPTNAPVPMPNSVYNFKANWATGGATSIPGTTFHSSPAPGDKEYSVFIGDLTPQTSEEDLVKVFMSPPDGMEAFESTVGAKIMRDPVSGSSKLFGFVRFTSEEDQQRALAEMGGIPCLGRPMRVSSASVKNRTASATASTSASPMSIGLGLPPRSISRSTTPELIHPRAISGLGIPVVGQPELPRARSVTAPVAQLGVPNQATSIYAFGNGLRLRTPSPGMPLLAPHSEVSASSLGTAPDLSSILQRQQASTSATGQPLDPQLALTLLQIQALAALPIAPNPNGPPVHHQVSYNDPNNSTVFVGGLSSLINEEMLQMFFAPFGEIGYVRIPPNKSCGFVHFVHKSDANRAIERLQGFPLAGTKVRLSWGKPSATESKPRRPNTESSSTPSTSPNIATIQAAQALQAAQLNLAMQNLGGLNYLSVPMLQQFAAVNSTMPSAQNNLLNTAGMQALINAQVAQANYGTNSFNQLGQMSAQQLNGTGGQSAPDHLILEQIQQQQLLSMQALQNSYANGQSTYGKPQSDPNLTPPFQPFSPIPLAVSNGSSASSYPSRLESNTTLLNPLSLGSDWNPSTSLLRPAEPDRSTRRPPSPTFLANSELLRRRVSNNSQAFGVSMDNEDLPGAGDYLQRLSSNGGGGALRASHGDLRVNLPTKDFRQRASSEAFALEDTFRSMSLKQTGGNRSSSHTYNPNVNGEQQYGRD